MTAEIAILNKSAIAMAADSAVTISSGNQQQKIFDNGDKLFELCNHNSIGVMVYNGMQFMDIPLPILIKEFRKNCNKYSKVRDAARAFLSYLNRIGKKSSRELFDKSVQNTLSPILQEIANKFQTAIFQNIQSDDGNVSTDGDISNMFNETFESVFKKYEVQIEKLNDARFVDRQTKIRFTKDDVANMQSTISKILPNIYQDYNERLVDFSKKLLKSGHFSDGRTGIVIAGFGENETFPTLIAYEIDGMIGKSLKYRRTKFCDIDRQGTRAAVIPFAQKEMVDRFLYGLDDKIQSDILEFCKQSVTSISEGIFDRITIANKDNEDALKSDTRLAEEKFVNDLSSNVFETIVDNSKSSVEGMVEFMPKPELAKMAEALIDLTSIKRRVSRGFETVGGPVDVVVISKSEGLVWVKRKHYFPRELNSRYFYRDERIENQNMEDFNE